MSNIISDIATLIKAGFSMDDIKEVVKAANESPAPQAQSPVQPAPVQPAPAPQAQAPAPQAQAADKGADDTPDYKALYEQSQKQLKELQEANTKGDMSPEPLKVDEIIKSVKSHIC